MVYNYLKFEIMKKNSVQFISKKCSKCGAIADSILTLNCKHNLCLECASTSLYREQIKTQSNSSVVLINTIGSNM